MAYVTWMDVATEVGGVAVLKQLLIGHAEDRAAADDEPHPFFDQQVIRAQQYADKQLRKGGYTVPLETPITDEMLRRAIIFTVIAFISDVSTQPDAGMQDLGKWGRDYLKKIGEGEENVVGETPRTAAERAVFANAHEVALFDYSDPTSPISDVFKPLGPFPFNRGRW